MRLLIILLFFSLSRTYAQREIQTQIYDFEQGAPGEESLVFLASGHVAAFSASDIKLLEKLKEAQRKNTWLRFTLGKGRVVLSVVEAEKPLALKSSGARQKSFFSYTPSVLKNLDQAKEIFALARMDFKHESQCYNRAHIWAYEWRVNKAVYSSKAWLFFTRKFIRQNKFEWWFHVAPMVHVIDEGFVKERIMDVKYSRSPLPLKQWTDIFMRDNANCPVVEQYSDQADHPESGSCFVMKSSMYYYQPADLEELELSGAVRDTWLESEVRNAYLEAFDKTLGEER